MGHIRSTIDSIEGILIQLDAIGEDVNHQTVLVQIIFDKFAQETIAEMDDKLPAGMAWNIPILRDNMQNLIEQKE